MKMSPIGPCPRTATTSSGLQIQHRTPFRQVFTGSTQQAWSKLTPSGMRSTPRSDNPIHRADILRKAAPGRLVSRRDADSLINRTLRIEAALAVETIAAGNMMKNDDAIARAEYA